MHRALKASLTLVLLAAAALGSASAAPALPEGAGPHPIDLERPYQASDYRFFGQAVRNRPVVALGESIHVTREMPIVRLNLLRYLHEELGMDVLALEGSLIDAWTAQEHAYRSRAPVHERARTFTREALFGLWQTDEMERVIAYALSTQASARPLYLTSFDLQPGTARAYGGSSQRSMEAFLSALRAADPQLDERQAQAWSRALGPAVGCHASLADDRPLRALEQWIERRAPAALGRSRPAVHLAALRLVPVMIRNRLQHCREWQAAGRTMPTYQRSRDVFNARLVLDLMRSMPNMVLWAHHSHVNHNSLRRSVPSMGQHLRAALGDRLYTVGLFAHGGAAMDSRLPDAAEGLGILAALASRPIPHDERFGVERRLAALSERDFFVDLSAAPEQWARPDFTRMEVDGRMVTALSRDFDGAVLLHRVSGAELNFLPPPFRAAVRLTGWVLRNPILAGLFALLLTWMLAMAIRGLWRRWRRRRARRPLAAS